MNSKPKLPARKVGQLTKLPSPRDLKSPSEENAPLEKMSSSISELNPFFEALILSSNPSSSVEGDEPTEVNGRHQQLENCHESNKKVVNCKGSVSSSLIKWSSQGSSNLPGLPTAVKSEESFSSSGDCHIDKCDKCKVREGLLSFSQSSGSEESMGNDRKRGFFTEKLKKVTHRVKKQLSITGGFIVDKLSKSSSKSNTRLSEMGLESADEDGDEAIHNVAKFQPKLVQVDKESIVYNFEKCSPVTKTFTETEVYPCSTKEDNQNVSFEASGLILSIPNWIESNLPEHSKNVLADLIEDEKRKIAMKSPMEWADAVEYLRKSVGRDFRRGYLALGEKMNLPNSVAVRCLKYNSSHSFLAVGCEKGTLILLELDFQKPLVDCLNDRQSFENLLYQVPTGSRCRIQMNETLVGHAFDLRCLAWNSVNGKLLSSDEIGCIIRWGYGDNGCWVEEMVNDRTSSMIVDMAWSPDGEKILLGYEDYFQDGSVTCGILLARADGTHVFDRKFPNSQVTFVLWYNESTIWVVVNNTIYTFDELGELGKVYRSITLKGSLNSRFDICAFMLKSNSSWITSDNAPEFIVVYRGSSMSMFKSLNDKAPVRVHIAMCTNCADWSANGLFIAIGGMPESDTDDPDLPDAFSQVNLYNYEGKLLQILKVPGYGLSSISWDHDSLHLSIATERQVYFASLRPMYKVIGNGSTHCYAYTKDCINHLIGFWNQTSHFTEAIPGKIIDIKCHNKTFAVLSMDSWGIYHIFTFAETGVHQQHFCVLTMEPFALTMTNTSIICLATNAILNWNYNLCNDEGGKNLGGALKQTRQVSIDDFPGIIPKPGEKRDHLLRPTLDYARCGHALEDRLCVARESGKLQVYALPTLGYLQTYQIDLDGDICQQILFNNDGSQLALLTMNGNLRICIFPKITGGHMDVILCEVLTSISGILWSSDFFQHICVLEANNVHVLHGGNVLETIANIPSGCYLTNFKNLFITLINMDRIIENPDKPSEEMLIHVPTPTLTKVQDALENSESVDDILKVLGFSYSHTLLRKLIADEAFRQGNTEVAEMVYIDDGNYAAVEFMRNLNKGDSLEMEKAQIFCFLSEYEQAQHYFLRAGRKDLAIKMWKDLCDWEKVNFLSGYAAEDVTDEALESQLDSCFYSQGWESAADICSKLGNAEGLMECCVMMEDYERLMILAEKLPMRIPLLYQIGEILASVGLIEGAVQCFVGYGEPAIAMKKAMDTQHWDLAMKLSYDFNLPLISSALVKYVRSLIASNKLSPAFQILERCGKTLTAGKLLVWKGLCMLQDEFEDTMEIKKIFVLAAHMLSKHATRTKRDNGTSSQFRSVFNEEDELDLEFLIPEAHLSIMIEHNEWCWSNPWRGAEAIHFLNLTQRFIYRGMMGRAFKAAVYLRNFEDIIGSERLNALIALTAINNNYFNVASNALLKLETDDEEFAEISFHLFKDKCPVDHEVSRFQCTGCAKFIPDYHSTCPYCKFQFIMCIFSACPILNEEEIWTCETCSRHVQLTKTDRFEYCLLCHTKKRALF